MTNKLPRREVSSLQRTSATPNLMNV